MRTISKSQKQQRRGAIIPFVAVLLPLFLIMVAFAIDFGVISVADQQLQNAADAGAVAALTAYQRNPADGDQAALETMNAHNFLGDRLEFDVIQSIEYGQFNAETNQFIVIPRTSGSNIIAHGETIPQGAQAVRVRLIRSPANDNAVNLFFAPLIGVERATVVAEAIAGGSTSCVGFVGVNSVNIGNDVRTDSYNSDLGPYSRGNNQAENGNVCSAGRVSLASGANVFGNAAGSNVHISPGSNAHVHGTISGPPSFDLAPNPAPPFNDNDTVDPNHPYGQPYHRSNNDLIVDQGRTLTLEAGTYHFRDMLIKGGGKLILNGRVEVFVDREMRFDNGSITNVSRPPKDFILNVDQGPVQIQGGNKIHGVIYAPDADVGIANGTEVSGSVTGKTLELQGGAQLRYDESLNANAQPTGPPTLVF